MSRKNNRDTDDYHNERYDNHNDHYREPRSIKPVIEDDRHTSKPNYVQKDDRRDTRPQYKE